MTVFDKQVWATALTSNSTTALEELGAIRWEASGSLVKGYRYVHINADTTVANGTVVGWLYTTAGDVTSDISDTVANLVAGVGIGAITAGNYGWIQFYGVHTAVATNGDDDIAAGTTLIWSADGVCDSVAAGTASTYKPIGIAAAADVDADNTVAAVLDCL